MNDRLVTDDMPEIVTPEMRDTCLEARDKIIELVTDNIILRSELKDVREERNNLINEVFRLRKMIRAAGGRPLTKGTPTLTVVQNGAQP